MLYKKDHIMSNFWVLEMSTDVLMKKVPGNYEASPGSNYEYENRDLVYLEIGYWLSFIRYLTSFWKLGLILFSASCVLVRDTRFVTSLYLVGPLWGKLLKQSFSYACVSGRPQSARGYFHHELGLRFEPYRGAWVFVYKISAMGLL